MRIPYQFVYHVYFMLNGGQRPVSRAVVDNDEVDIPEITGSEAPVAATWNEWAPGQQHDRKPIEIRTYDGRCYQQFKQANTNYKTNPSPEEAVRWCVGATGTPGKMPSDNQIAHRLGDNRQVVMDYHRSKLDRLILIDGVPHSLCPTPKIVMRVDQDSVRISATRGEFSGSSLNGQGLDKMLLAPLTEYTTIIERAQATGNRIYDSIHDLDIRIPEALWFDSKLEAIARTVGQALADNESQLHTWPRPIAEAFIAAREDLKRWHADNDSVDIVELLDRTYAIFTSGPIYIQTHIASFLANYDEVQKYIPDLEISLSIAPRP